MVVLNSRDCQEKLWPPKKYAPKNNTITKTAHKHIGTTLPRLKIY